MDSPRCNDRLTASAKSWSEHIALLAADALFDAGLFGSNATDEAAAILAEEVYARLSLLDYPPMQERTRPAADT